MRRGDIVKINLPRPQGKPGAEQFGARPAVVIQCNKVGANLSTTIVVPITSSLSALKHAGSFQIAPDENNGLGLQSVVLTQQIRALDQSRIVGVIGQLSPTDMTRLEDELRKLLKL